LGGTVRPEDIEIERNEAGIFAHVNVFSHGKNGKVTIWSKVGGQAAEYQEMSDEDLQKIAFDRWRLMETSRLRRKKQ
jgi:hypothetical protein